MNTKRMTFGLRLRKALILSLLTVLSGSLLADVIVAHGVISTSMVRLLAHPDKYEGKKVQIIGYYARGQELRAIFLTSEDCKAGNTQSALWINLGDSPTNALVDTKIKSGPVLVIGTFHHDVDEGVGHMGMWPGELKNISLLQKH